MLASACGDDPQPPANKPPILTGPSVQSADVTSGAAVAISLQATDPDNDSLTYAWAQTPASPAGAFSDPAAASPTWTAPQVTSVTSFQLGVTVSDGREGTVRRSVTVVVRPPVPANRAPVIASGTPSASPSSVTGAVAIQLSLSASDADDDALTYSWTQEPATPVGAFSSLSAANPTWTSPEVSTPQRFTLRVTVSDGNGGTVQGQVEVDVAPPSNQNAAPTLTAGPTASSTTVNSQQSVNLSVTAADADGDSLTYAWNQTPSSPAGAFSNTSAATPTWTAPTVTTQTNFQLRVTVSDGKGGLVAGSVTVTVLPPPNRSPTISQGPQASPTSVTGAAAVQLSVTAADADGDSLTYAWTQTPASPAGTFSTTSTANPTWTSPVVASTQIFTLVVTVSDGKGGSVDGQVNVTVAPPEPQNGAPTLTAGPTANPTTVDSQQSTNLSVTASDPDGDPLTYAWTQEPADPAGSFSSTTVANPSWTAPAVTAQTTFQLRVTVSDGKGGSASGAVAVTVRPPPNQSPTISQGPQASPTSVMGAAAIQLSVTAADPDGDPLTYAWTQVPASPAGTFSSTTTSNPTWTSPVVASTQTFTLAVTVSDGQGGSVDGQVDVTVAPPMPQNNPPTLTGPTATPSTLDAQQATSLAVTASDPDGDPLTYAWTQEPPDPAGSFSSTTTSNPTWTAPKTAAETTFQLRVTVSDDRGGSANSAAPVTVRAFVNTAPTLTAGPSASATTVNEQQSISLSVSATDADGDPLTYAWSQVSPASPVGTFSSTSATNPTWIAPNVTATGTYQLRVTVSDGQGGSVEGTINISVVLVNQAPVVSATISGPASLSAGTTGSFSITASDPDGDPLTITWTQTSPATQGTWVSRSGTSAQWFSPVVSAQTSFTIRVSVTDQQSAPVTRSITFPVNVPAYTEVQNVWNTAPSCTACHGASGGLSLAAGSSHANLVNVATNNAACSTLMRVVPGDPDNSALIRKMEGTTCGSRMPASDTNYFTNNPGLVVRVRSWILAGAANN
ncbi:MAG: tandem-95 repeat protein [Myxococcaceae bacterium]|nr:tandem-95 repeat protein [Myxococcaceae bacterium]